MLGQLGLSPDLPEAERRALVARVPFVGYRPAGAPTPAAAVGPRSER
jgi:hypothetical protein